MPIVSNRNYNDPALGAAFSNLAAAFGPPSGSDLAGYAAANAKKQEAARLAELFAYAKDPNYDQTTADRMGVLGGLYAPSQSYYSVDQGNATTRRGQDITAQTSILNNQADNARAIQTNTADNRRAFAQTLLAPIGANETRPGVDVDVLGALGLGGVPALPEQRGIVTLNQGEMATMTDGSTLAGAPKPLTEAEVKGAERMRLAQSGQLTDTMLLDTIIGDKAPVEVVGPDGKPVYMAPGQAARTGAPAFVKPTADSATELTKLMTERDALPPDDPRRQAYNARIAALGRGQQQSAYDRGLDEDLNKLNTTIFEGARSAYAERGLYNTVLAAVDNPQVDQGTLATATLGLRKALTAFGVPAGNTGPAEMLNALGGQIALKLRNADGANMPGAMSDADREFLKSMSVSLGNSPEANRLLAQYYLGIQQRAIDLNDLRDGYVQKNGRLDEGFRTEMANYLRTADPTAKLRDQIAGRETAAPAPAAAPAPSAGPQPGVVEDGYRFKGGNPSDPNNWEAVQ